MLQAASYADCQENLVLVNHGTGHRISFVFQQQVIKEYVILNYQACLSTTQT